MKISDAGLELIKSFEGCKLEAYPDPGTGGDPWTIGVGHTGPEVVPGLTITQERADELLREDLAKFEACVGSAVGQHVTEPEFAACVSLAFNIGCAAFTKSTLARKIRDGDPEGAAQEFLRWDKAGGKQMAGLTRRRGAERDLFLS